MPEAGDPRPWEGRGFARRDCEPHRGHFLALMGTISLVCGFLSLVFCLAGLIGLPLGIATSIMADRDLLKMGKGLMDPDGISQTVRAGTRGVGGAVFSLIGLLICGLIQANFLWSFAFVRVD